MRSWDGIRAQVVELRGEGRHMENPQSDNGVAAMIETMPLEEAPGAYAKMMAGTARFRIVLNMGT
jgi:D-arabinose 1-dehydrogenase-like Zn-dependent alcohol dehydrogenase